MEIDVARANAQLTGAHPKTIIEWTVGLGGKSIVTTSFGPYAAVILHMACQVQPDIPVVWIDSGYATRQTYLFADRIIDAFDLNLHVYNPLISAARRDALMGIPDVADPNHADFTHQVKLEPFSRAMAELAPDVWLTAVRRDQTEFRKHMTVVSQTKRDGVIKIAPVLDWSEADMQAYLDAHGLPNETRYYDPTKVLSNRECGLHTRFSA